MKDYQLSEQAFIDVWEKYNSPDEIYGSEKCYEFLKQLLLATGGWVILDQFSHANYDKIREITFKKPYTILHWENLDKNPRGFQDELLYVYGAHYIYSFCDIQKIRFLNVKGHLVLLVLPRALVMKEVKNALGINRIPNDQIFEDNHPEELSSEIKFIRKNKVHHCIVHGLPFYSFLIQPKEHDFDTSTSKKIMMIETLREAVKRAERIREKVKNEIQENEQDELRSSGNVLRTILESLLKYYCLYFGYSLPNEIYGKNLLGMIKDHLKSKMDTGVLPMVNQDMINLANGLSHDSGRIFTKDDVIRLHGYVNEIAECVFKLIKEKSKI